MFCYNAIYTYVNATSAFFNLGYDHQQTIKKLSLGILLMIWGILFIGYYFTELSFLLNVFSFPEFSTVGLHGKTFNMSLSVLEEPKNGSKNAFYAQILFFSMMVIGIGYIFVEIYKKVSAADSSSAVNAELLKEELMKRAMAEWSGPSLNAEKVHEALLWNKNGEMQLDKVVPASQIIEHSNVLVGMPLLKEHEVMLSNVRNVEMYYEKYNQWVASRPGWKSPSDSYEVLQGCENVKAIEHFMSQKNADLTTSIISIDASGRKFIDFDTKTIDYLYCERMSSMWNAISMQNCDYPYPTTISSFITDASIVPVPKLCSLDVSKRDWFNRIYPDKNLDFPLLPDLMPITPPLSPLPPRPPEDVGTITPYEPTPAEAARIEKISAYLSSRMDKMEARHAAKPADDDSSGGNSEN